MQNLVLAKYVNISYTFQGHNVKIIPTHCRPKQLDKISNNLTKTFTKLWTNSLPFVALNSSSTENHIILLNFQFLIEYLIGKITCFWQATIETKLFLVFLGLVDVYIALIKKFNKCWNKWLRLKEFLYCTTHDLITHISIFSCNSVILFLSARIIPQTTSANKKCTVQYSYFTIN